MELCSGQPKPLYTCAKRAGEDCLRFRPLRSTRAVFERDADVPQPVADRVAGGEVFGGAGVGPKLDQQLDNAAGIVSPR